MGVPLIYQKIIYNISIIAFTYYCVHSIIVRNKKSKKSEAANMKEKYDFSKEKEKNGNIVPKRFWKDPWGLRKNFRKPSAIRVYVAKKQMRYFRRINFQKLYLRLIES